MLIFNLMFWLQGSKVIAPADTWLTHKAALAGISLAALLCLVSLSFGIKAWRASSATLQPSGLAAAGTLVSLLALVLWVITGADLVMVRSDSFRPMSGKRILYLLLMVAEDKVKSY